jgi:hypothetical protein
LEIVHRKEKMNNYVLFLLEAGAAQMRLARLFQSEELHRADHQSTAFATRDTSRATRTDTEQHSKLFRKNRHQRELTYAQRRAAPPSSGALPSQGCPLAALGADTARCDGSVREAATEGFTKIIDITAGQLTNIRPDTARKRALVVMSTMIGALTMSRVVDDPGLSDTILRQAARHIKDFLAGN